MEPGMIVPLKSPFHMPWERGVRVKGGNMNVGAMTSNMLVFKEAMDKAEIPFILIFGTLLGVIREKEFIVYDSDADVACYAKDHQKIHRVIKELESKGFYVPNKNESPLHDHFFIRSGEKIDIWWFDEIDNDWIYDKYVRYAKKFFDTPEEVDFLNTKFLVPNNPKEFLNITYGSTWTTPFHINDSRSNYILDRTMPGGKKR